VLCGYLFVSGGLDGIVWVRKRDLRPDVKRGRRASQELQYTLY
jgi:hypothetical protein